MQFALIFTRHKLTEPQLADLERAELAPVHLTELASETVTTLDRALEMARILVGMYPDKPVLEIYGVFPAPIRWALEQILGSGMAESDRTVFLYESFNTNRAPEGEKPQFIHIRWLLTQTFNE